MNIRTRLTTNPAVKDAAKSIARQAGSLASAYGINQDASTHQQINDKSHRAIPNLSSAPKINTIGNANVSSSRLAQFSSLSLTSPIEKSVLDSNSTYSGNGLLRIRTFQHLDAKLNRKPEAGEQTFTFSGVPVKGVLQEKSNIPVQLAETFTNSEYKTVKLTEDLVVYRHTSIDSNKGGPYGGFASIESCCPHTARHRSAIKAAWNDLNFLEIPIKIPAGTTIDIGNIAAQDCDKFGDLAGGGTQVLLPENWQTKPELGFQVFFPPLSNLAFETPT